ncbi:MAG TPA: DUF3040 domain-containing protein [Streptosporangiaceae bacterium]|jgi:hypothetical protein
MALSAQEQQALAAIEGELAAAAPRLAAELDQFSARTSGAAMPLRETIRHGWRRARSRPPRGRRWLPSWLSWLPGTGWPAAPGRTQPGQRPWLLLWIPITVALIATALAVSSVSPVGCGVASCPSAWPTSSTQAGQR